MPDVEGPVVHTRLSREGRPLGAAATLRLERSVDEVWAILSDVERYARYLPMVRRLDKRGERVTFQLGMKVAFFSAGFEFTADATYDPPKRLDLRWVSGEPRDMHLQFTVTPIEGGKACVVEAATSFDVQSLGWLVKYFLKHHPEIQHGIFPGVALNLLHSLRRALGDVER